MANHDHTRDAIHRRLAARGICKDEHTLFLQSRHDVRKLVAQLVRKMPFMLEHELVSEVELIDLMEDPELDLSAAYATIFAWLVRTRREATLDWFLDHADVSRHFPDAVHSAACAGAAGVLRVLLAHGASPSHGDSAALRYAAFHGHETVVRELITAGADPGARDYEAARMARAGGHESLAALVAAH